MCQVLCWPPTTTTYITTRHEQLFPRQLVWRGYYERYDVLSSIFSEHRPKAGEA